MPKFLGIAQYYTHSQNFDCHDFFPFWGLQCSLVDISKFPWQKKRNKQTKSKYLLTILKRLGISKDNVTKNISNRYFIKRNNFKVRTALVIYKGGQEIELDTKFD